MSRIGKTPIIIPEKIKVTKTGNTLSVKGSLGELSRAFGKEVDITVTDHEVQVIPTERTIFARALWGTSAAHIRNMIHGVNTPFVKKLIVEGIGFKSAVQGTSIILNLGFSHPILLEIPKGLTVTTEKNIISISGIDKEQVGSFAAFMRSKKKPEPYKGKGIRYEKEVIRRKEGKKSS